MKNTEKIITYHLKAYFNKNGLKIEKNLIIAHKEDESFYYYETPILSTPITCCFKHKINLGTYLISPNKYDREILDKIIIAESWCLKNDYSKSRAYLIKTYQEYIPLIKKNILEIEKEMLENKKKLINYKKGFKIFINKIKKSN